MLLPVVFGGWELGEEGSLLYVLCQGTWVLGRYSTILERRVINHTEALMHSLYLFVSAVHRHALDIIRKN